MDHTDSLEDWVAIREHPFLDTSKPSRLEFLVAWNEVDWKIAITCRERSRVASDTEAKGWSKLFSLSELQSIHEQLALVHPSLGPLLPKLPEEPRGIWSYITPPDPPSDNLCEQLMTYLRCALDICGSTLLTSTLCEEHDCEEYFEKISELRRRGYDEAIDRAEDELKNVLFLRSGSINMLDMAEVYLLEDQALFKLNIALAQLYNYLIQPFLDMREMAFDKLREARNGLKNPDLGKRRKDELAAMFTEWNENYTLALDRIQELYMEYYEKTVSILSEVKERMLEDKAKFGQKAFEISALERYNRVCEDLILEKLQLLNNTKRHYDNQREKVKQKIASLDPESVADQLQPLEQEVYSWQRKVYDVQLEISQLEEELIRNRIQVLQQEQRGDDFEFFDAVETEEELKNLMDCQDPEINRRIKSLKRKLVTILKKRAQIRNRYKKLENDKVTKEMNKVHKEEAFKQHHSVQMKRENQASAMELKQEFIKQERRKTLQRLKEYKMKKHPVPSTIKPRKALTNKNTSKPSKPTGAKDQMDSASLSSTSSPDEPPKAPPVSEEATNHTVTSLSDSNQLPGSDASVIPPVPPPPPPPPPPPLCPPPLISLGSSGKYPAASHVQTDAGKCNEQNLPENSGERSASGDSLAKISLDCIRDAKGRLKKVSTTEHSNSRSKGKPSSAVSVDPMTDVLQLIKHGVKLRPVDRDKVKDRSEVGSPKHIVPSSDSHTQQLMDVIERISSRLNIESDNEENSDVYDDFD